MVKKVKETAFTDAPIYYTSITSKREERPMENILSTHCTGSTTTSRGYGAQMGRRWGINGFFVEKPVSFKKPRIYWRTLVVIYSVSVGQKGSDRFFSSITSVSIRISCLSKCALHEGSPCHCSSAAIFSRFVVKEKLWISALFSLMIIYDSARLRHLYLNISKPTALVLLLLNIQS